MGRLGWRDVAGRLGAARYFWLHTTGANGAPHASPVWGVVVDDVLYHYTVSTTVKAHDLAADPRVVVHLESAEEVVMVHGRLRHLGRPGTQPAVVDAFARKYDGPDEVPFLPSSDPVFDVLYALEPERAVTWSLPDSEASTRRWSAGEAPPGAAPAR